ncbi:MAG: DNA-3-methyladenine glycosylase I [Pseudomonadota bacterium]
MSYCQFAYQHPLHQEHHDREHGFPVADEKVLFERLVLEINQPGLSWLTVLKKREHFRDAFAGYDLEQLASYGTGEIEQLLKNPGIIRHRQKIEAVVYNAQQILDFVDGFSGWLQQLHPCPLDAWVKCFRKVFRFTGPSVVHEFLMSVGYLPGAHQKECPVYEKVLRANPAWAEI